MSRTDVRCVSAATADDARNAAAVLARPEREGITVLLSHAERGARVVLLDCWFMLDEVTWKTGSELRTSGAARALGKSDVSVEVEPLDADFDGDDLLSQADSPLSQVSDDPEKQEPFLERVSGDSIARAVRQAFKLGVSLTKKVDGEESSDEDDAEDDVLPNAATPEWARLAVNRLLRDEDLRHDVMQETCERVSRELLATPERAWQTATGVPQGTYFPCMVNHARNAAGFVGRRLRADAIDPSETPAQVDHSSHAVLDFSAQEREAFWVEFIRSTGTQPREMTILLMHGAGAGPDQIAATLGINEAQQATTVTGWLRRISAIRPDSTMGARVVDARWSRLLELEPSLTVDEGVLLILAIAGLPQVRMASELQRSPAWVSAKLDALFDRLIEPKERELLQWFHRATRKSSAGNPAIRDEARALAARLEITEPELHARGADLYLRRKQFKNAGKGVAQDARGSSTSDYETAEDEP